MAGGIRARALAPMETERMDSTSVRMGVPFVLRFVVTTSDSTITIRNTFSDAFHVVRAYGYMTQGGAGSDTAVVNQINAAGTTTAITDTADLSAFADTEQFDFSEIDDAVNDIQVNEQLSITTASSPACVIFCDCVWLNP